MGWRLKSAEFKLLSLMPGGDRLYTYLQEQVTRSTVANRARVEQKMAVGLDFWSWLHQRGWTEKLPVGNWLDVGAGWHPTIPLLWYSFGNERQTLVDISPNMDAKKVLESTRLFRAIASDPGWTGREWLKRMPELQNAQDSRAEPLLSPLGIEYRAPYDGLLAGRPNCYDVAVCTQVLQHLPRPALIGLFKELHHTLKPGGLFHATVHFVGQFRSPQLRRGQYQHLTCSPTVWDRWYNSRLMGFNRLKGPDYRELLSEAGFRLLEFRLTGPATEDLAELSRTRIHSCFRHYAPEDLAARGVFFVAEKA